MTDDTDSCWNATFADNGIKMRGEHPSASSLSRTTHHMQCVALATPDSRFPATEDMDEVFNIKAATRYFFTET
jgi:hypothetical protein